MAKKKVTKSSIIALQDYKHAQEEENHNALIQAFIRIQNNAPLVLKKGTKLSATSVAQEAKLSRGTLYKHKDILLKINAYKENPHSSEYRRRKALEAKEAEGVKKTKSLIDQLSIDKNKLAQENYKLTIEIADMRNKLTNLIKQNAKSNVKDIRPT